ncbi:MAG TPA: agmatinase [Myxococcales bacterium]|nr:agmatinase [Deltaproteobacteria bacterium]MBU52084.1 agmatinase [Deltaproteobacteria bacterium]HAA55601.1 agmatinase [Myxococcales bacterium]|tara:strand:- start:10149 stop:11033 length:885 start_codon:yes stop_codon:yes gene_type:complete
MSNILDSLDDSCPSYMSAQRHLDNASVALVGVPFDGTSSFRPGSRFGPDAIRAVSIALETYSPHLDLDLEDLIFADIGNLDVGTGHPEKVAAQAGELCRFLVSEGITPLLIGGDHSWTPGCIHDLLSLYPDLVVVQIDAHADLRPSFMGEPYSHASGMRRALDQLASTSFLQVGIRSGTKEEWRELRATERFVSAESSSLATRLEGWSERPLYLTFDLDIFDPSVFPGTGVPEPGGIDWRTCEALFDELRGYNIIAADVVELSPQLDPTQASSILAAKVVRELVLLLAESKGAR